MTSSKPTIADNIRTLASAQKSNAGAPLYSRLVNRPLGRVLAAVAHRIGMSPDQVTLVSAACTLAGIVALALAPLSPAATIGTTVLLMLGYALDSADGQLARLRHGGSKAGEWLDHVADAIKLATLHSAVAIGLFRAGLEPRALLLPLAYGAVQYVHFFTYILTYQLRHHGGTPLARNEARPGLAKAILSAPTDYGLLCLVLALRCEPAVFLWVYGLMLVGHTAYLLLALPKWYLEMRRL